VRLESTGETWTTDYGSWANLRSGDTLHIEYTVHFLKECK